MTLQKLSCPKWTVCGIWPAIDNTRVTNSWDAAGQQIVSADVTGITSMVWDLDSRKTAVQNPTGINLTSTLDAIGNRLVLKDNFGTTSYTWDQQSRLLSIWNPLNERTTIQWDNLDREQHRVLGNGGTISHTWDAAGRETLIENRDKNGAGQFIATNTYSPVDNRLTVLEMDGTRATYAYDVASQIVNEARGGTMAYARSYIWDPLGNRIQQYDSGILTAGTFNKANQLTLLTPATGPTTVCSYDATGNLILQNSNGALTTQTWTPENRLASYADPAGNSEQFLYSDDGLKKQRTNASGVTLFTYDEAALLLETSTGLALHARYTNRPKTWGRLASQSRSGVSSFYGFDSQMSARILVSIAGVITDSYSYKAFGEELQSGSGTDNVYRFGALVLYYRELADLLNALHRWPQPSAGRFRSMDPSVFDIPNRYGFTDNNPVSKWDPRGNQATGFPFGPDPTVPTPPFDPNRWNSPSVQPNNNCTCYAFNLEYGTFLWPGELRNLPESSNGYFVPANPPGTYRFVFDCKLLINNSIGDGLVRPSGNSKDKCPSGYHLVDLYVTQDPNGSDYHWYRKDSNGRWSNKPGHLPATNCQAYNAAVLDPGRGWINDLYGDDSNLDLLPNTPINPAKDARERGYNIPCGRLCAPNQWV